MEKYPLKVAVLGHSFIRRLSEFVASDKGRSNLGLNERKFAIRMRGIGGLKLSHKQLHCFENEFMNSDIVILDIGSNDLCDRRFSPEMFVRHLISYADYLRAGLDVKLVAVCQLLFRGVEPFIGYNERVIAVNKLLEETLKDADSVYLWKHRAGLWDSTVNNLDQYGVHLSWDIGYPKYLRSLRDCVLRMSRKLRNQAENMVA